MALEQIFADLGAPSAAPAPIAGAVDIRAIEPAKPQPVAPPKPEPAAVEPAKAEPVKAGAKKSASAKPAADAAAAEKESASKTGKKAGAKADPKASEAKKGSKKAEKAPPSHPSRIWVQIGVGRNETAIAFDWRKHTREKPALFRGRQAYVSDMGQTNRILIGPFETAKAAAGTVAELKKGGFPGAFAWTSPAGHAVDPLSGK